MVPQGVAPWGPPLSSPRSLATTMTFDPAEPSAHWTYHQRTGEVVAPDGVMEGHCYSGHGAGLNNPLLQDVVRVGPIPRGWYSIGPAHVSDHTGPITMNLDPLPGTETFGRSLLRWHGDNKWLNHSASEGCIVGGRAIRLEVAQSVHRYLEVV